MAQGTRATRGRWIVRLRPGLTTNRPCVGTNCVSCPLLFNMLSRVVITFLPRSKCLSVSWLQSPFAVILEPPKIKFALGSLDLYR